MEKWRGGERVKKAFYKREGAEYLNSTHPNNYSFDIKNHL